jgi:transcriptional regulator with XRE-family HTH domain
MTMIVVDVEGTGQRIKSLMEEKNISAIDIQKRLNLSVSYGVYKWLYGMSLPKIDHLVILADMFGVTMDDIVMTKRI